MQIMKIQRKEAACLGGEIADARRHAQFTAHLNLDASPVPHNDTSRAIDMPRSR